MLVTGGALRAITDAPGYRGQIRHVERQAGTAPRFARTAAPLPPGLERYLEASGFELYVHQARALDAWRAGDDVLLATRTASGKSLAFNCCVADVLAADRRATALYLYPTKALARDQLAALAALDAAAALDASPAAYDGDTPSAARAKIRRSSRIVVSNPYGLHEYLAQPAALERFLANLAVVVLDEAHRYRGVLGANVALVLRRLVRIARRLGARPRFVLASGTIANPAEHGAALVGRPVTVVDDDGGAQGPREVVLFDSALDPERSLGLQAAEVTAALVGAGQSTICFAGSRVLAELVATWAGRAAPGARIACYRAGYLASERREIEADLRSGRLDAVVSTNALELGIDVGGLDAVVMAGYPGTVASTWQQIGRAGRAHRPALAVLVTGEDPLDSYLARRPEVLFGAPVERAVVALQNESVLAGQVLCASAEMAVRADDVELFGGALPGVLAALESEGLVARVPSGLGFVGTFRPASRIRLDGRADGVVEVRVGAAILEVLDRARALRQAYPGAILLHRGEQYRVVGLDLESGVAQAERCEVAEHTRAVVTRSYRTGAPEQTRPVGPWVVGLGPAEVRSTVTGYKMFRADEPVTTVPLDLPETVLETRALWLVPGGAASPPELARDALGALHGAEHALIHALPLLAMCDRGDAGGASTVLDPARGTPLVLLYDAYDGGAGIADAAYAHLEDLVGLALDMLDGCDCETGCPRCIFDRDCGSGNADLDRIGALAVLAELRAR